MANAVTEQLRSTSLGVAYFVQPVPALAVALMILNDHFLKFHFPGALTGKLSDFAGVFFFPLFLFAVVSIIHNFVVGRAKPKLWLSRRGILIAIATTDLIFVAVKTSSACNGLYIQAMAQLGFPSRLVMDPSDLWALAVNPVTYLYAKRFFTSGE